MVDRIKTWKWAIHHPSLNSIKAYFLTLTYSSFKQEFFILWLNNEFFFHPAFCPLSPALFSSLSNLIQRHLPSLLFCLYAYKSSLPPAIDQFCPSQVSLAFPYILYLGTALNTAASKVVQNTPFPPFSPYGWYHVCLSLLPAYLKLPCILNTIPLPHPKTDLS